MGVPILILLAIVWAIVLVPPYVRRRAEVRPGSSVMSFRHNLEVLGRAAPGAPVRAALPPAPGMPTTRAAARKRRRDVLFTLAGAAGFTLLLAIAFGGPALLLHLGVDVALGLYVYLLVQLRKLAQEPPVTVVPYIAPRVPHRAELVVVRRTATG
jgi:hypothetical protein